MKDLIAIITARGGSKGIPKKNLAVLNNKPLISYSIEAAQRSKYCDEVYVTTDDIEISSVSKKLGAKVIERPKELSEDHSKSEDAVSHALLQISKLSSLPKWGILLQPTSPLRTASDIDSCFEKVQSSNFLSAISVSESDHSPYKMLTIDENRELKPLFDKKLLSAPRQNLPQVFKQNGAIYLFQIEPFLSEKSFFIEKCFAFEMPKSKSIDIDSKEDLEACEIILKGNL